MGIQVGDLSEEEYTEKMERNLERKERRYKSDEYYIALGRLLSDEKKLDNEQ